MEFLRSTGVHSASQPQVVLDIADEFEVCPDTVVRDDAEELECELVKEARAQHEHLVRRQNLSSSWQLCFFLSGDFFLLSDLPSHIVILVFETSSAVIAILCDESVIGRPLDRTRTSLRFICLQVDDRCPLIHCSQAYFSPSTKIILISAVF